MSCTPEELNAVLQKFIGGSSERFRHPANPSFIISEGVHAVLQHADASWLIDLAGLTFAPVYARAWLAGDASVGSIELEVKNSLQGPSAIVRLVLSDYGPPAMVETIPKTNFPHGSWQFFLCTDQVGESEYITTMIIPQEY